MCLQVDHNVTVALKEKMQDKYVFFKEFIVKAGNQGTIDIVSSYVHALAFKYESGVLTSKIERKGRTMYSQLVSAGFYHAYVDNTCGMTYGEKLGTVRYSVHYPSGYRIKIPILAYREEICYAGLSLGEPCVALTYYYLTNKVKSDLITYLDLIKSSLFLLNKY